MYGDVEIDFLIDCLRRELEQVNREIVALERAANDVELRPAQSRRSLPKTVRRHWRRHGLPPGKRTS
jgi:hypothetical protein